MNNYNYKAAIIGCHGSGKSSLCEKLKFNYKVYPEESINRFMGKNAFLSELEIINNYANTNNSYFKEEIPFVSDRFGILSVLIYAKGFHELKWINNDQYRTIINVINDSNVDWVMPNKLIYMNESEEVIKSFISKRGRVGFNEEDDKYLTTIRDIYNYFYETKEKGFDFLGGINENLIKKIYSIPIFSINNNNSLESIISLID